MWGIAQSSTTLPLSYTWKLAGPRGTYRRAVNVDRLKHHASRRRTGTGSWSTPEELVRQKRLRAASSLVRVTPLGIEFSVVQGVFAV